MSHHITTEPPFEPEQIVWLEESRRDSVRRAVKRFRNAALVGYLVLTVGVVVAFQNNHNESTQRRAQGVAQRDAIVKSGSAVAVDGCNRDFKTITGLRAVLMDAKTFQRNQLKQGHITPQQYATAKSYYNTQLGRLVLPDCRRAASVITQNPDKPVPAPVPLHP